MLSVQRTGLLRSALPAPLRRPPGLAAPGPRCPPPTPCPSATPPRTSLRCPARVLASLSSRLGRGLAVGKSRTSPGKRGPSPWEPLTGRGAPGTEVWQKREHKSGALSARTLLPSSSWPAGHSHASVETEHSHDRGRTCPDSARRAQDGSRTLAAHRAPAGGGRAGGHGGQAGEMRGRVPWASGT